MIVFFMDSRQSNTSVITKFVSIPRLKTNSCTVSSLSMLSPRANEKQTKFLLAVFSCFQSSLLIKSMRRTIVLDSEIFSNFPLNSGHITRALLPRLAMRKWLVAFGEVVSYNESGLCNTINEDQLA